MFGVMVKRENNGNGEPIYKVFGLPIGSYFAPMASTALIGIGIWLIQLNGDMSYFTRVIAKVEKEQDERSTYIGKFIKIESEINRIGAVQENVIAGNVISIASLRTRVDQLASDMSGQKVSCERVWQRVDELRRDVDRIIIKLNPSDEVLRK